MQTYEIYRARLSTASDVRAVRTRAALRQALLKLLESRPIDQITVRDIADSAGIAYTTFFRHHPTKEALLDDLAAEELRRMVDLCVPVMDAKSARAASVALFAYVSEHRALWSTFLTGGAAAAMREGLLQIALGIAVERSQPENWPVTELATRLIVGGTVEMLAWWMRQGATPPVEEIAEVHLQTVVLPAVHSQERMGQVSKPAGTAPKRRPRQAV